MYKEIHLLLYPMLSGEYIIDAASAHRGGSHIAKMYLQYVSRAQLAHATTQS